MYMDQINTAFEYNKYQLLLNTLVLSLHLLKVIYDFYLEMSLKSMTKIHTFNGNHKVIW